MTIWTIDFETYSEANLKREGLWKYMEHPSTRAYCLAWKKDDQPAKVWPVDDPIDLFLGIHQGNAVSAFNAQFEFAMWPNFQRQHRLAPELKLGQVRDSMARACVGGLPSSLGGCAAALRAPIQKDKEGHRLMMRLCKPDKDGNPPVIRPGDLERLYQYCKTDVDSEFSCDRLLPELSPQEQALWELTVRMNMRGLRCDVEHCRKAIDWFNEYEAAANARLAELTGGAVKTGKQVKKLAEAIRAEGVQIKSLSKDSVKKAEATTEKSAALLQIRKDVAMSSVKKFQSMIDMTCDDGMIRGTLKYYGAATGRWSGQGIQPQNFPRGTVKDVATVLAALDAGILDLLYAPPAPALASAVRAMVLPPFGTGFIDGDYSAIEARVLCWLAGESGFVQAYREGKDTYILMARRIYALTGGVTPDQRQLGKKAELGCGYGLGPVKFRESCDLDGITISKELAERTVKEYRESHPMVMKFWNEMEAAAVQAIQSRGTVVQVGKLKWRSNRDWLMLRLPNGRLLYYYRPRIVMGKTPWGAMKEMIEYTSQYQGKPYDDRTYGGRLVENATQAVARDTMAEAMLRLEAKDYANVLTVHDEILVAEQFGNTETEFREIMEIVPAWAAGLPIKVGTWTNPVYRK